jgi:hypothetical protein
MPLLIGTLVGAVLLPTIFFGSIYVAGPFGLAFLGAAIFGGLIGWGVVLTWMDEQ